FTCTADTLFKLASGKLDPIFAFTTGKLRVEGNLEKAMKLQNFVKK
ncbi:MAG: SCP2 sterol-binding domain-containing protein, partial [Ruminococcus sp.]|nr:SCP2 sterol-binding domain-containing protein [Ruminococcus sp.]